MRIKHTVSSILTFAALGHTLNSVCASGSGSGSGDEPWNYYGGDDNFYAFSEYGDAAMHWSEYSIYPEACITRGGSDIIVYSMYSDGNNQCKKKSLGKYYVTVAQFVKAVSKENEKTAELQDYDFDEPNALYYLDCRQGSSDDDGTTFYTKLGCKQDAWKALAVNAYSDKYCSEKLSSYNYQVDLSDIQINYQTCQSCSDWTIPDDDGFDDQIASESEYFAPLCSAAWNYRETCDGACQRQMKLATGAAKNRKYTGSQKFMLFFLSTVGLFSFAGLMINRKKMSTEDALLEDAQVERVGLQKSHLSKAVGGTVFLIILLMLFKVKGLTFFLLIAIDLFLIGYWARLEYRQKGRIQLGGFHLYGDDDEERSIS